MKLKIEIQPSFEYLGKKIQPITWSPDFVIKNTFQPIIIDTKGYPNDAFPLKYKMVLNHFHNISINKNIAKVPHIWFVNTKSKFIIALQCIKRVLNDQEINIRIETGKKLHLTCRARIKQKVNLLRVFSTAGAAKLKIIGQ